MKLSRREGRYLRRVQRRRLHKLERVKEVGTIEDIYTFSAMYKYGSNCCRGVRWKQSIQNFERHLFSGTARRRKDFLAGKYKWHKCTSFILNERGKQRKIDAPHVHDRQIQKLFTKDVLVPLYTPQMVYNNGASLKGKGLKFSQEQVKKDLREHFKRYGMNGYIILTDCSKFFPSADHERLKKLHEKLMFNKGIRDLADSIVGSILPEKGMPIGIEPSQMEMVHYPTALDTYMTCQVGLKCYGHYMDDFYMFVPPDMDVKKVLALFLKKAEDCRIILNPKKTHIIKFGTPFRFCKSKYVITDTGKIMVHGSRETAKRFRKKLKTFMQKLKAGAMSYADLWAATQSVLNYYAKTNDHGRILALRRLFYKTFGFSCEHFEEFAARDCDIKYYNAVELHLPCEL